jgi:membrane-bound lytic murein transglycosylase D
VAENEPQVLQKEALDLCQSASEKLARGETEAAVQDLDHAYERMLRLPNQGDDTYLQAKADIRMLVASLLMKTRRGVDAAEAARARTFDLAMPLVENEHVQREIKSFLGPERELFIEGYQRSGLYREMIVTKLEQAGLPNRLAWLPLVESWFKARALSRASALGLWQFIASTGLRYGLGRDQWIDERLDPEKATDGAIAYLTELHALFGDWPKALAAYNCGEARVQRLQTRSSGEYLDFWDLYETLPGETRRYVPRLLAAILIIENPQQYGMVLPEPMRPLPNVTSMPVDRSIELDKLDEAIDLEQGTLRSLNAELRFGVTPKHSYALRVPADRLAAASARIATLPEYKRPLPSYTTHRVRSGETLGTIARRYGTTVGAIMRVNGLRRSKRLRIGQRLRIPIRGGNLL